MECLTAKVRYLELMREALDGAVRHVQREPHYRHRARRVLIRPRHVWNHREVEAVSAFSARMAAHFYGSQSGIVERMMKGVRRNPLLWHSVSAQPVGYATTHVDAYLVEDLAGLLEKYFTRRPTQRGVSRALIDELLDNYAQLLDSESHDASAVIPLVGLEGPIRQVELDGGVRVRKLTTAELQEMFALGQESLSGALYSSRELMRWHYCIEADMRIPRTDRPRLGFIWSEFGLALTAVRMATNGRIGCTVGWIKPAPPTMLDIADRVVRVPADVGDPVATVLNRRKGSEAQRIYRLLRGRPTDNRLTLALQRYNSGATRDYATDQLLDSWIGLETLFAPDIGTEITYRIRLRAARFLGRSARERRDLFAFLGESYGARSKIIHGDDAPADLPDLAEETQQRLRDAILGWMDSTRPHDVESLDAAALGR